MALAQMAFTLKAVIGRDRVRVHVHVPRVQTLDTECTWRPTSMLHVFYAYDLLVELVTDYTVVVSCERIEASTRGHGTRECLLLPVVSNT